MEAVASLEIEVSRSTLSVIELEGANMEEIRSIRSTGVISSKTKASVKTQVISVIAAASLIMMVVGNLSA